MTIVTEETDERVEPESSRLCKVNVSVAFGGSEFSITTRLAATFESVQAL